MRLQDWKLSELGESIWTKKYQNNGESFAKIKEHFHKVIGEV